ncbi:uncharacterized protein LOC121373601 isoform X1 [Gigantopelta aegis]|uniref:uncharacterized protein LOC121373601 isoform X1 n=1 Tax=Gigantopelta aegis TaxID=1735272 RepID=UPI001B88B007|nr:uncharacterized protein LOC121373601 isoform X1 [Gigantopelta aegis]XP_041356226.1 uncharacterized protein LOC121373601 isoform X1 [Gigantopelta aegis]XP_041356227.1 uncharacterized protein LOC121373601 isoform X1 [Gigantopelta aegis]
MLVEQGEAVLEIKPCVLHWFDGIALNLTCVLRSGTIDEDIFISKCKEPIVLCNSNFMACYSIEPRRYSVVGVPSVSATMLIKSFAKGRHDTEWTCLDYTPVSAPLSCNITLSAPYGVKDENLTTLTTVTLPFSISVTGSCTYLLPNCIWTYKIQGESEERVPDGLTEITNTSAHCNSGDQQATCTLKFNRNRKLRSVFHRKTKKKGDDGQNEANNLGRTKLITKETKILHFSETCTRVGKTQ